MRSHATQAYAARAATRSRAYYFPNSERYLLCWHAMRVELAAHIINAFTALRLATTLAIDFTHGARPLGNRLIDFFVAYRVT